MSEFKGILIDRKTFRAKYRPTVSLRILYPELSWVSYRGNTLEHWEMQSKNLSELHRARLGYFSTDFDSIIPLEFILGPDLISSLQRKQKP